MTTYSAMLRTLSVEELANTLTLCGRKAREGYFARHQVRAPKALATAVGHGQKNAQRARLLHGVLQKVADEPLAEELLRQLFLSHRPLLARALDALDVPHDDGLTDDPELKRFAALSDEQQRALVATLEQSKVAGNQYAAIYVPYMREQMRAATEQRADAEAQPG